MYNPKKEWYLEALYCYIVFRADAVKPKPVME